MKPLNVRYILWALAAAAALAAPRYLMGREPIRQRSTGVATIGAPFILTDSTGAQFNSETLVGAPFAVFFGFTHCPDICPTTTAELSAMLKTLGEAGKGFKVLFITVDPARDTPPVLKDFLSSFDSRIIGLTGTQAQIADLVLSYGATAQKVDLDNGEYTVDHTATVYLMDGQGRLSSTLTPDENADVKLAKLKRLLAASP